MKRKIYYISICCKAEVKTETSPDFIGEKKPSKYYDGTCWFVCTKCNKPCDIKENK